VYTKRQLSIHWNSAKRFLAGFFTSCLALFSWPFPPIQLTLVGLGQEHAYFFFSLGLISLHSAWGIMFFGLGFSFAGAGFGAASYWVKLVFFVSVICSVSLFRFSRAPLLFLHQSHQELSCYGKVG
jgi:hypothetical protein